MKLKIDFVVNEYFLEVVFSSLKTHHLISHNYRMNFMGKTVKPLEAIINRTITIGAYAVERGNSGALIQSMEVQRQIWHKILGAHVKYIILPIQLFTSSVFKIFFTV